MEVISFKMKLTILEVKRFQRYGFEVRHISGNIYDVKCKNNFGKKRKVTQKKKLMKTPLISPPKGGSIKGFHFVVFFLEVIKKISLDVMPLLDKFPEELLTKMMDEYLNTMHFPFGGSAGCRLRDMSMPCTLESNVDVTFNNIPLKKSITRKSITKSTSNTSLQKKNKKKTSLQENGLESSYDKIIKNLFIEISKLGLPFFKHRIGSSIYSEAFKLLSKHYKKHRSDLLEVFILAKEYFNNSDFIYHPQRISIPQFFKYSSYEKSRIPALSKIKVNSWFKEFSKGREHIEKNFMIIKDYYPELSKIIIGHWRHFVKQDNISSYEKRALIVFTDKIVKYAKINKLSVRTIFDIINKNFLSTGKEQINNPMFFNSKYFFEQVLPRILIQSGVVNSKRDLNKK